MYKNVHDLNLPRNCLKVNWLNRERQLRSNVNAELVITRTNTKFGEHNMSQRGPRAWIKLPLDIKEANGFSDFKMAIKTFDGFVHTR